MPSVASQVTKLAAKPMLCPTCWGNTKKTCGTCKGARTIADRQLSTHFLLSELISSDAAVRNGLDNNPSVEIIENLTLLCTDLLEPLREQFGPIVISSGYRAPAVNTAAGSKAATSAHLLGFTADLKPGKPIPFKTMMDWIIASKLPYDQVIYEYGSWIHFGRLKARKVAPRKQSLMTFDGTYQTYNPKDARVR